MIKKIVFGPFREASTIGILGFTVTVSPEIEYNIEDFTSQLQGILKFPLAEKAPKVVRLQGIFSEDEMIQWIAGISTLKDHGFKIEIISWDEKYFPIFNYADRVILFHDASKDHTPFPCDELVILVEDKLPKEYPKGVFELLNGKQAPRILEVYFKNLDPEEMLAFLGIFEGNIRMYPFGPSLELTIWPLKKQEKKEDLENG